MFAHAARGTIFYLTNAEKPGGAFDTDSFFSLHVIPKLKPTYVQRVAVLSVHREGVGMLTKTVL